MTNHSREMALTFRRAAQILQARGHAKGWFSDTDGRVCAVGALLAATGTDPTTVPDQGVVDYSPTLMYLSSRLWVAIDDPDPVERIAEWNDQPARTQAEVVEALVSAARAIEAREATALIPTSVVLAGEVAS